MEGPLVQIRPIGGFDSSGRTGMLILRMLIEQHGREDE